MASRLGMPVPDFQTSYWRRRPEYDEAALDPLAYWNTVARRPLEESEAARIQDLDSHSWTHPNPPMPEWARQVRAAGRRTALLSNMPAPVRDCVIHCDWLPEFDHYTFSCDVRRTKPSPVIYEHCLAGLGADRTETLFVDDRTENVRAAEALGIPSLLFTGISELAAALENRFDIPVPPLLK